ncbi:hypothetical protein GCM10028807_58700 [Spirosoma daeguense]
MSKKYNKYEDINNRFSNNSIVKKLTIVIGTAFLLWMPADCVYTIYKNEVRHSALTGKKLRTRAVVINTKNFFGNSPVSHEFSYSYRFEVNSKYYEGDTRDASYHIGDSIEIEYVPSNPSYNQPVAKSE